MDRKINVVGEAYYGKHTSVPFDRIYDTREEAESALKTNRMCYFSTEDKVINEVEVSIKT